MTRELATILSIVCAAIGCTVLIPRPAMAGSYVVHACSPEMSPGLWAHINSAPDGFASGNLCGGPEIGPLDGSSSGSLYSEDILNSPANIPDGARAGWMITAPPGALITAISYYRTLASHGSRDLAAGLFTTTGAVLEQCRIGMPFGSPIVCSMPNNQAPVALSNLSTTGLFFGVMCDLVQQGVSACVSGGTIHDVQAYMYSANVTVTENSVPTVTNVGGTLWAGGLVNGTVPVTFSATDAIGIREQAVQSDSGQTIVSTLHGCDFAQQPPCPQQPSATLNVDTTRVADGAHTFRLVVTDPASNSQVLTSPPVTVDNYGPPPPLALTATPGPGSTSITLAWTNPANPPAPVSSAMAQLCTTTCTPAVSVNPGAAQLTAPSPGVYSVRVWLLDTAGRGGAHNAAVTTVTVPSTTPPPPLRTRIAALLKGRRLHVSGPITASGRVTVSWRSKIHRRTVAHDTRAITIHDHRLRATFTIPRRARTHHATIRVAIRSQRRILGQARARRG